MDTAIGGGIRSQVGQLLAVLLLVTADGQGTGRTCSKKADIVFMLDSSGSVRRNNFELMLDFVSNVTSVWDIGQDKIRVGLLTYSSGVVFEFSLDRYDDHQSLSNATLSIPYSGGGTATDIGLKHMREVMFNATNGDRPGVPNIGVVITDGASNDQKKTASQAQSARDAGILLLAVGIQNANMAELNAIATDPDSDHVFTVSNFFQLSNITASFQATTCTAIAEPVCTKLQDIVFMLDSSPHVSNDHFRRLLRFVSNVTRGWVIGEAKVRVGVMTFSEDARVEFHLNQYGDGSALRAGIAGVSYTGGTGRTDMVSALRYLKNVMFNVTNGDRPDVDNVAIVITVGQTRDANVTQSDVRDDVRRSDITLFAVGVGRSRNDGFLTDLASAPEAVFIANDSMDLNQSVTRAVQRGVCDGLGRGDCRHSLPTLIGVFVAIGFLTLIVLAFIFVKKFRQGATQGTLLSMTLAMLVSWVVFLVGFTRMMESPVLCLAMAALLHYSILASFLWLLTKGLLMYLLLVTSVRRFLIKISFLTWGLPLVPVAVVMAIDRNLYVDGHKCCWMSLTPFPFYWAFLAPLGGILVVSIIIYVLVGLTGCCSNKGAAGVLVSLPCLAASGLSWVFAYFTIEDDQEVFQYLFTITASLHGFLVFFDFFIRPCRDAVDTVDTKE